MSKRLPEFIEPLRLAESGRSLSGCLPVRRLRRLAESLSGTDGEVEVSMDFSLDGQGRPHVVGSLSVEVEVLCQRCLEAMRLPLRLDLHLGLVSSDTEGADLPEDMDALIVSGTPTSLADIVEDELILALPLVPVHPLEACSARTEYATPAEGEEQRPEGPFAALAALKTGKHH